MQLAAKIVTTNSCMLTHQGANQAVATARLMQGSRRKARFVCRFGDDAHAELLERELVANGVDVSGCRKVAGTPSGHGMVMLEPDGAASSVVLGGSNLAWDKVRHHLLDGCRTGTVSGFGPSIVVR